MSLEKQGLCPELVYNLFSLKYCSLQQVSPQKKLPVNDYDNVKVYGTVISGYYLENSAITLLNLDGTYSNYSLTIRIKSIDRKKFSNSPETFLKGKENVVSGNVVEFKGKPEIIVSEMGKVVVE